ncbi:hypothetical protein [Caballeronia udeis]|uniref:hypothetical protein n=1 Tax=Caballeronia udeis TaxID=1232866 RepID=UPI0012E84923|nr:hypothetical protein [Caballeronia udeis]
MSEGAKLPALTVFFDTATYWLADGFHRLAAARLAGGFEVEVDVRSGSRREALLHSLGANAAHGLRRTNEDKRKAINGMLADFSDWSDKRIAKHVGVSDKTVATRRAAIFGISEDASPARTVERGGRAYLQDTTNIGKRPAIQPAPPSVESDATTQVVEQRVKSENAGVGSHSTQVEIDSGAAYANSRVSRDEYSSAAASEDTQSDDDVWTENASLRDRVSALNRQIDSLKETDRGAEIHRLSQLVLNLENRDHAASEKLKQQEKQLKWFGSRFADLRKLLNVKYDRDVVTAVNQLKVAK